MNRASPFEKLVQGIYGRTRPTASARIGGVQASTAQFLWFAVHKGLVPYMRGLLILRWRLGKCEGPLFLGRGARVLFPRQLYLGTSCAIGPYCQVNCLSSGGVKLGDRVTLREFGWVQLSSSPRFLGDCLTIEADTYIGPFAVLGAGAPVRIGSGCQIGAGFRLSAEEHEVGDTGAEVGGDVTRRGIEIGDNCWIGNNVCVLDGVTIGRNSVVGAGAVVTSDLPPFSVAVGVPARVIRELAN